MPAIQLAPLDWVIISFFLGLFLLIGFLSGKKSGQSTTEFFLSGRSMPWWMLGISMVATTFSADTPNLVTDIVRQNGVSGNWQWWAFLLTGMLTVFVYARLWRRSGIFTDLEFYKLRYAGWEADFIRAFRSVYLGLFFNAVIMATVMLAGIKIGGALLGFSPGKTIILASVVTLIYSALGGLRAVILTDIIQFILAMIGAIGAAIVIVNLPEIGGLGKLLAIPEVSVKTQILPDFSNKTTLISLFIIPLAVQWWSAWYPGAEPGGGGYVAQRILASKTEKDAMTGTFLFNIAHYALRPWPWILVALASIVIFPDLESLRQAFPMLPDSKMGHDLAYPAMLRYLPSGLLGIVVISLMAAFMSTLSTHLNWGSSYLVNDLYKAYLKKDASEKELVTIGRLCTILLLIISIILALFLENALSAFNILLQIGAGTGLIYIMRWFWYRINAWSEVSAMIVSFLLALYFETIHSKLGFEPLEIHSKFVLGVGITTLIWLIVTFVTKPVNPDKLLSFYIKINPWKAGWKPIASIAKEKNLVSQEPETAIGTELTAMTVGIFTIYGFLFMTGYILYGENVLALISGLVAFAGTAILIRLWPRLFRS